MTQPIAFPDGGYSFIKGGFPYCQGVLALDGFAIERVRLARPLPLAQGFATIERYLGSIGRPLTALCAAELRSPQPFTLSGFGEFNKGYVDVLKRWSIFRDDTNPVARSNVAPEIDPPVEPSFYAFCHTVAVASSLPTFVVAGSGEWPSGGRFPEDIVAHGDVSPGGIRLKVRSVMDAMEARLTDLGLEWKDISAAQAYTVHDIHAVLRDEIVPRSGNGAGLTWHYCRPPIRGLEFEMDVRGVAAERVIDA